MCSFLQPQDSYGLEKLASEELCMHYNRDFGIECRVARFHNIYGPHGTWKGGREKAPAAFCRKVSSHARHAATLLQDHSNCSYQWLSFLYMAGVVGAALARPSTPAVSVLAALYRGMESDVDIDYGNTSQLAVSLPQADRQVVWQVSSLLLHLCKRLCWRCFTFPTLKRL